MFPVGWDLDLKLVRQRERAAAADLARLDRCCPFALGLALAAYLHPTRHVAGDGPVLAVRPLRRRLAVADRVPRARADPAASRGSLDADRRARHHRRRGRRRHRLERAGDRAGRARVGRRMGLRADPGVEIALFVVVVVLVVVRPLLHRAAAARVTGARRRSCCRVALAGAYATDAIGIHAVFGAFLVGAAMPRTGLGHRRSRSSRRHLRRRQRCSCPIYFVMSGMAVDIPGLEPGDLGRRSC